MAAKPAGIDMERNYVNVTLCISHDTKKHPPSGRGQDRVTDYKFWALILDTLWSIDSQKKLVNLMPSDVRF